MVGNVSVNLPPGAQTGKLDPNAPSPTGAQHSGQTTETQQSVPATGTGALAPTNGSGVPDPVQASLQGAKGFAAFGAMAMLQSIFAMMPPMSNDDQDALVAEIASKLKDTQSKSATEKIKTDEAIKEATFAEQKKQLDDAAQKIKDAVAETTGPLSWVKRIFSAIMSVFEMIAGLVMLVVAPNPLALLLIAGGVDGMMTAVDPESKGLMGEMVKAFGGSDDDAQKAQMGFSIGMAAITLILSIALLFVPGAEEIGVAGILDIADSTAAMIETGVNIAQTAMSVASVAVDVADAAVNYDASQKQAEAMDMKAQAKSLQALIGELDSMIDIAMSLLMNSQKAFNNMIDNAIDAMNDKGATLAHAKMKG